jgi:hypothetical protein
VTVTCVIVFNDFHNCIFFNNSAAVVIDVRIKKCSDLKAAGFRFEKFIILNCFSDAVG